MASNESSDNDWLILCMFVSGIESGAETMTRELQVPCAMLEHASRYDLRIRGDNLW